MSYILKDEGTLSKVRKNAYLTTLIMGYEISKFGLGLCDLSSKLESDLGFKDHNKSIEFMKKMKSINENSLV